MPVKRKQVDAFFECRMHTTTAVQEIEGLLRYAVPDFAAVYEMLKATTEYLENESRKIPDLIKVR
jgi:hypothetical protein